MAFVYRKVKVKVEEIHQWFKHGDCPSACLTHFVEDTRTTGSDPCLTCGKPMSNHAVSFHRGMDHIVCPGHWLVFDEGYGWYSYSQKEIDREYEFVKEK